MGKPEILTVTMRELDRLKVIQAVVEHGLMVWRAAEKLGISKRQVERLVQRYRQDGPRGLVSRKWGQPGHRQLPPGLESRVRGLIRDSYADFGPTLAAEKLRERHGIEISKACVRRIMIDAGFWVPRKLRPPKVHQPRNRRACLGELVQIDGSDHAHRTSPYIGEGSIQQRLIGSTINLVDECNVSPLWEYQIKLLACRCERGHDKAWT